MYYSTLNSATTLNRNSGRTTNTIQYNTIQYFTADNRPFFPRMEAIYRITSNLRRTHFSHFSELKMRVRLKFEVYFALRNSRQHLFPRRISGLATTAINCMVSEMCVLANVSAWISLFKRGTRLQSVFVLNTRACWIRSNTAVMFPDRWV
jgi:hypothetical protein